MYHYTDVMFMIFKRSQELAAYEHYKLTHSNSAHKCQECGMYNSGHMYVDGLKGICPDCKKHTLAIANELSSMLDKISKDIKANAR